MMRRLVRCRGTRACWTTEPEPECNCISSRVNWRTRYGVMVFLYYRAARFTRQSNQNCLRVENQSEGY